MKNLAVIVAILFLFAFDNFGQSTSGTTYITPSVITIQKTMSSGSPVYKTTSDSFLGFRDTITYRIIFILDLSSIPDSALISDVDLGFGAIHAIDSIAFTYKVVSVPYTTVGNENWWNACTNGTVFKSSIQTSNLLSPTFTYTTTDDTFFLASVERALPANKMAIALVSYNESLRNAFSAVSIGSVKISWIIPSFTVKNDFNNGWFKINGNTYVGSKTTLTAVGRSFTLTTDDQLYNGVQKYFGGWHLPAQLGGTNISSKSFTFTVNKAMILQYPLTLNFTALFADPVSIVVENNFGGGVIGVDSDTLSSGSQVARKAGTNVSLKSMQQDYQGYNRVWNNFAENNRSIWSKRKIWLPALVTPITDALMPSYQFTMGWSDTGYIYTANMPKYFRLSRLKNFPEVNIAQNDGVQANIVEQNSGTLSAPASTTDASGNVYKFSYWPDVLTNVNPRTVTPTDNTTYTAVYKALSASATSTAYAEGSARKFVRSAATTAFPNGILHNVYESQGQIWYEASTDNGTTWNILNGGTPISGIGNTCLNPSIAAGSGDGNIYAAITYFRAVPGAPGTYQLKMQAWTFTNNLNPSYLSADIYNSLSPNTASGLYAGVELTGTNRVVVLYSTDGWYNMPYWYAQISSSGITNVQSGTLNATSGMRSVSVSASRNGNNGFHVLYQGSNNTIYYTYLSETNGGTLLQTTPRDVSTGSGFTQNHSPSVVIMPDGEPRACWVGYGSLFNYETESSYNENTVVFRGINASNYFWNFDDQVQQANINSSINGSNNTATYLVGWVRGNAAPYQNKYMKPTSFTTFSTFNTTGKYLQVCNGFLGNDYNELAAMSFNTGSLPYKFQMSSSSAPQGPIVSEKIRPQDMELYRSGVAFRDSAQFKFRIGGLSVDGTKIAFPEIPDTVVIGSLASANAWLVSNPFEVNNNSTFTYHVFYSPVDTANARAVLGENDQVAFKTQLVDANTGEVLGTFDEVSFTRNNLLQYKNGGYEVSTGGIGKRTVVLKISALDNTNMHYAISQKVTSELADTKTNMMKTSFRGNPVVKKYSISQNYPNPFNPTTVISYDLPADGHVSLRVYSILGKEVMCLVNEQQTAGTHQVEFNASKRASGIYLYKFECNGYTSVKKMSFMK